MLLGMPGAEKFGLIIDCKQKTLTFPNGKRMSYRGLTCQTCKCNQEQVSNNRIQVESVLMQSPKLQTVLLPGQEIELRPKSALTGKRSRTQNFLDHSVIVVFLKRFEKRLDSSSTRIKMTLQENRKGDQRERNALFQSVLRAWKCLELERSS